LKVSLLKVSFVQLVGTVSQAKMLKSATQVLTTIKNEHIVMNFVFPVLLVLIVLKEALTIPLMTQRVHRENTAMVPLNPIAVKGTSVTVQAENHARSLPTETMPLQKASMIAFNVRLAIIVMNLVSPKMIC